MLGCDICDIVALKMHKLEIQEFAKSEKFILAACQLECCSHWPDNESGVCCFGLVFGSSLRQDKIFHHCNIFYIFVAVPGGEGSSSCKHPKVRVR